MASSKCWFILGRTDYPPPTIPLNGTGRSTGPICLGHLIPNIQHFDNVINRRKGPASIPPDMPIYPSKGTNFTWETSRGQQTDIGGNVGVPIAAAAGLTVHMDVSAAFQQTTKQFVEFETLETWIIQPTREYVEDTMDDDDVAAYLRDRGPFRSSSIFMITGIKVARGAKTGVERIHRKAIQGAPTVDFAGLASVGVGAQVSVDVKDASSVTTSDFIWAIRLAKISKGALDKIWLDSPSWSWSTYTSGATYGQGGGESETSRRIIDALAVEKVRIEELPRLGPDDYLYVVLDAPLPDPPIHNP